MPTLIKLILGLLADLFRSRAALEAEILVLRQQIIVLRRRKPARLPFMPTDKLVLGRVCRVFPNARDALALVRPETVVRWHRAGFRSYWRWKQKSSLCVPITSSVLIAWPNRLPSARDDRADMLLPDLVHLTP